MADKDFVVKNSLVVNTAFTVNSTALYFNDTQFINATSFVGTSNNSTNLNGQPASFYTNATNLSTGTVSSARLTGAYTNITQVGTLTGLVVTGNSNFDSGVLFVDGVNNRVGINNTAPNTTLTVSGNGYFTGKVKIDGDLEILGTTIATGVSQGDLVPAGPGYKIGNSASRWDAFLITVNVSNSITVPVLTVNTSLTIGSMTVNTTAFGSNNSGFVLLGNTTTNTFANSTILRLSAAGTNSSLTPTSLTIGNTTSNVVVNTSGIYINSNFIESSGGFYKGNNGSKGNTANKANIFKINSNTLTTNVTIEAGENAMTAGPLVVANGVNLVVQTGGRVVIV